MVADDITAGAGLSGYGVNQIQFSVSNFNSSAVSAQAVLELFASDPNSGAPTTLITSIVFNPISFGVGTTLYTYSSASSIFTMPSTLFWAGLYFTDDGGTTGATAAQLNELGQGIYGPPTVGSSFDVFFQSTNPGSIASNPTGNFHDFNGSPAADFGFSFSTLQTVPEPSSLVLLGVAGAVIVGRGAVRRRRRAA